MKLWSTLPPTREHEGQFWVTDDAGAIVFGPVRARGEADNSGAAAHGNVVEDPTKAFGDHPAGRYHVARVSWNPTPAHSYGPCFMLLDPIGGEALEAKQNGRSGIGIHGGDPGAGGILRATFGCLRLENEAAAAAGHLVDMAMAEGPVEYECMVQA